MKLVLTNFRCYAQKTIELPENGIHLIKGDSGAGKSTILNAILFALYGDLVKPYTWGTTSCGVSLTSKKYNVEITRTCRPNRLVVKYENKTYEDQVAQGVIDTIFRTTAAEFNISSYFHQEKPGSFLTIPPREQLAFIEKVAGITEDYESDRELIKERISELTGTLQKIQSEHAAFEKLLREKEGVVGNFSNEKVTDIQALKQIYAQYETRIKTITAQLKSKKLELVKLRELAENQKSLELTKAKIQAEYDNYEMLRSEIGEILEESIIQGMASNLESLRSTLSGITRLKEAVDLETEMEKIKKEHTNSLIDELNQLKSKLLDDDTFKECEEKTKNYEELSQKCRSAKTLTEDYESQKTSLTCAIDKVRESTSQLFNITNKTSLKSISTNISLSTFLKKKVAEMEKNLEKLDHRISISKRICMKCPGCQVDLALENDELIIFSVPSKPTKKEDVESLTLSRIELVETYKSAQNLVNTLTTTLEKLESLVQPETSEPIECISLKEFQDYTIKMTSHIETQKKIASLKSAVKSKSYPKSVERLQRDIKSKRSGIPKNLNLTQNVEELEVQIEELDKAIDLAWRKRGEYSKYSREMNSRQKTLDSAKKKFVKNVDSVNHDGLESQIAELETELEKVNTYIQSTQSSLLKATIYQEYQAIQRELSNLTLKEEEVLKTLEGVYALDKASRAAHIQTLTTTINNINRNSRVYLDQLFPERKISVRLEIKTHTKSGDVASNIFIGVRVDYKGMEDFDVGSLSGGEKQRINLAMLLGVNDLFNSSTLLLDECLNNLHSGIQYDTLEFLKSVCPDKQILVVSHNSIDGVCDYVTEVV
jgi:DNA repair exonuclease SbcCD ATPase subunit